MTGEKTRIPGKVGQGLRVCEKLYDPQIRPGKACDDHHKKVDDEKCGKDPERPPDEEIKQGTSAGETLCDQKPAQGEEHGNRH